MSASHFSEVVQAAHRRAMEIEPKFADTVQAVLDKLAGQAANAFEEMVVDHLAASSARDRRRADWRELVRHSSDHWPLMLSSLALTASAPGVEPTSTMVALYPRPDEAQALEHAAPGEPAETLHVTLAYLGDTEGTLSELVDALRQVAATHAPLVGKVGGIGAFDDNGSGHPAIVLPDAPGLVELRQQVCSAITNTNGVDYSTEHGYTPHLTVAYHKNDLTLPGRDSYGKPLHFDAIHVVRGDVPLAVIPLCGPAVMLAAGDPPPWTPPGADEVIDVGAVVKTLRTKTDPVRQALIANVMGEILHGKGLDWEATNPFAARVLAQSGSQIVDIASTTQLNAMRIIRSSWEEGLSIPDTAKAIRTGMRDASAGRALLIARTELVGAANGGSLAATQIVSEATDTGYQKEWLTAEGAVYPRHEEYEGLDGQRQDLDAYFDVGGVELQYPGDPDGPPEDICNCRCALAYVEA